MALQSMVDRQRGRAPESWGAGPPGGYGATQYDAATLGHAVSQQHLLDQMAAYGLPPAQDTSYGAPLRRCVASGHYKHASRGFPTEMLELPTYLLGLSTHLFEAHRCVS